MTLCVGHTLLQFFKGSTLFLDLLVGVVDLRLELGLFELQGFKGVLAGVDGPVQLFKAFFLLLCSSSGLLDLFIDLLYFFFSSGDLLGKCLLLLLVLHKGLLQVLKMLLHLADTFGLGFGLEGGCITSSA